MEYYIELLSKPVSGLTVLMMMITSVAIGFIIYDYLIGKKWNSKK